MTASNSELSSIFVHASVKALLQTYLPQLREAVSPLSDEHVWWRPNEVSNSIGNLLMHLKGSVDQWLVAPFEKRDIPRDRPREFSATEGPTGAELLDRLTASVEEAGRAMSRLTADELAATYTIFGRSVTGMEAIFHCVTHFILHYGQIVYAVKTIQNRDLGFFPSKTVR